MLNKHKFVLLSLLSALGGSALAEGIDLDHAAEFRLRYFNNNSLLLTEANPKQDSFFQQRFKLGARVKASNNLFGQLTLVHNANWGHTDHLYFDATGEPVGSGDSRTGQFDGASNSENMVLVNEAYGVWALSKELAIKFGRSSMGLADGTVVGLNDWQPMMNATEGVTVQYDTANFKVGFVGAKFADWGFDKTAPINSPTDPESNVFGIAADWKLLPDFLNMAHVHLIQVQKDELQVDPAPFSSTAVSEKFVIQAAEERFRYGLTVGGETVGVDYRLSYAGHTGEFSRGGNNVDREGYMYDAEVGYTVPDLMKLRVSGLYHRDSGDDPTTTNKTEMYDRFQYERHKNAGLMDLFEWGNLSYYQIGASIEPIADMTVHVQYIGFTKTEADSTNVIAGDNLATLALSQGNLRYLTTSAGDDDLGSEIDVTVSQSFGPEFVLLARYGLFEPGNAFKNTSLNSQSLNESYSQYFVEAEIKF